MTGRVPGLWAPSGLRPETGPGPSLCRTARANNPGVVLTFVLPMEQSQLGRIEELLGGGKSRARLHPGCLGPSGGKGAGTVV